MTRGALARLVARLFTPVVLVISGGYLMIYLYRWEWNRAVISGIFFLAAEIAFVGSSLRRDVRALAERTEALEEHTERRLQARLGESTARPARPFGWLRDSTVQGTGVFVPVLLGAGVLFSAVAFVVERVSGAVAKGTVDRATVRQLTGLQPLSGGLLAARAQAEPPRAQPRDQRLDIAGRLAAVVMLTLIVVAAVDVLGDATQTRPESVVPGTSTRVELQIGQQRDRPPVEAAEALVVACRGSLRRDTQITQVLGIGGDHVQLLVEPALGDLRRRRLFGCLEDATLDLVWAHVVEWENRETTGGVPASWDLWPAAE